jgi:hypothetical protein
MRFKRVNPALLVELLYCFCIVPHVAPNVEGDLQLLSGFLDKCFFTTRPLVFIVINAQPSQAQFKKESVKGVKDLPAEQDVVKPIERMAHIHSI